MNRLWKTVLLVIVYVAVIFLPVIPLQSAPVVPHPVYRLTSVSLFGLVQRYVAPLVGVSYRWEWYTLVVLLSLLAVAVIASVLLLRRGAR